MSTGRRTIFWPTAKPFELIVESAGRTPAGYYYAANSFTTSEHGGTHLDAPVHFAAGQVDDRGDSPRTPGWTGLVIDVSEPSARNATIRSPLTRSMRGSARTARFRRDRSSFPNRLGPAVGRSRGYLGTAKTGTEGAAELHFPGIHPTRPVGWSRTAASMPSGSTRPVSTTGRRRR